MSMLDDQIRLQKEAFGIDLEKCDPELRMKYLRDNVLAMIDELMEALAETGWKPWASSTHLNTGAFHSELVDAWHFFMNLMALSGMTMEDLEEGYYKKRAKNVARQQEGYDGVSTKCPQCHRALDDDAVLCTKDMCFA